ncbi:MAG: AmmeMemoRadiSam system protein B [Candidatus Schekmanbacteria bacterium RBG_13_48_7]|uniref:MEMO1 family protein A2161_10855 n=1 Tax=Candidatus Schekmanbacteria bacterium RBG_13_48_7 TaxID=1817878 RepID=A0A1F7RS24_9BACT|nr:MAG: AmmeMemoRadiSam system protein B [Candidatus Schekmanbacteria bacterium RBG_13_48_7]
MPVRTPAVAGSFYPGDSVQLKNMILSFLKEAGKPTVQGKLIALIAPHAGYVYSGGVAAYSYKELIGRDYDTVIILGPSHFAPINGAAVFTNGYYETPLGKIPVNSDMAKKICSSDPPVLDLAKPHFSREHSIEVQLPFLQVTLKKFLIVPILIGQTDENFCKELAKQIFKAAEGTKTLIVASSDMSHYPPYDIANETDKNTLKLIQNFDAHSIHAASQQMMQKYAAMELRTCLCGEQGVITTIYAAKQLGANHADILKYANSGDSSAGDKKTVVGYGAVAFYE